MNEVNKGGYSLIDMDLWRCQSYQSQTFGNNGYVVSIVWGCSDINFIRH